MNQYEIQNCLSNVLLFDILFKHLNLNNTITKKKIKKQQNYINLISLMIIEYYIKN